MLDASYAAEALLQQFRGGSVEANGTARDSTFRSEGSMAPTHLLKVQSDRQKYLHQFMDPETGWYRYWYLELRLEEEMLRSIRHGRDLSVVLIDLRSPADDRG